MQGFQQRLIVFTLFFTAIYADVTIFSFAPKTFKGLFGDQDQETIYSNHAQLWANVSNCKVECHCLGTVDPLDDIYPLFFLKAPNDNIGYVTIADLKPNTNYNFTLTCKGTSETTVKHTYKTDYGRPSAPKDILLAVNNTVLNINWTLVTPAETNFNYIKITVDNKLLSKITDTATLSYKQDHTYAPGETHKIRVQTCYVTKQSSTICSQSDEKSFTVPSAPTTPAPEPQAPTTPVSQTQGPTTQASVTTTSGTAAPTTTAPKSLGVNSYSISIFMTICSLVFLI